MPGLVLGIIPFLLSLFTGSISLFFFSLFLTSGAVGDFIILFILRNQKKSNYVLDHPIKIGCYVYGIKPKFEDDVKGL